jgi:FKBP-type peptidyl-prolyl cis-trans isomerase 2
MTSKARRKHKHPQEEHVEEIPAGSGGKTKLLFVVLALAVLAVLFLVVNSSRNGGSSSGTTTLSTTPASRQWDVAQSGDVVEVDYTGRFQNGTLFDTSSKDIAVKAGIYNAMRYYQPIVFTIGLNEVIPGVEEAVVGMKTGENKTVTIPPEKAYGYWDKANVETIPRIRNSSRVEEIPLSIFYNVTGELPVAGKPVQVSGIPWVITVLAVNSENVTIMHNPQNGTVVPTAYGNSTLALTDDRIYARLDVNKGDKIISSMGVATVLDVTADSITVDANSELAGATLVYDLKLISINQVEDTYAKQIQQQVLQQGQQQGQ